MGTHQCQTSLALVRYLPLLAHSLGVFKSKDTQWIYVMLCSLKCCGKGWPAGFLEDDPELLLLLKGW